MKTCTKCGASKALDEFYVLKAGRSGRVNPGRFPECKACNRARALAHQRAMRLADPAYNRRSRLRRMYGISLEDYDAMLARQGGHCAICPATEVGGRGGSFHIDHDHETGQVRGLLCHGCNVGIGNLGEDVDRLMAAAAYLLSTQNVLPAVVF